MPQALITINGLPGSDDNLPIGNLVQLNNTNIGGELTYQWTILDQPPGAVDSLSNPAIQNPTFTPTKEGTYLLRLIVNLSLPDEQRNQVVGAVRQLKTLERIPAAGETTEDDVSDGWATSTNSLFRRIDLQLADPGTVVGVNTSGVVLSAGDVVRVTSMATIKPGLPGQEYVPGFIKALATSGGDLDELLGCVVGNLAGATTIANGALGKFKIYGSILNLALGGAAVVGDTVYVSDAGVVALAAGTFRRRCGSIGAVVSSGIYDVWFDGVGGQDITPISAPYVIYGNPGTLMNANRIDSVSPTGANIFLGPYTFKSNAASVVTVVMRRHGVSGADIHQWQNETGGVLAQMEATGDLTFINNGTQRIRDAINQAASATVAPVRARRFNAGATANLIAVEDETGAVLAWFDSAGNLDLNGKYLEHAIARGTGASDPVLRVRRFSAPATANLVEVQNEAGAVLSRFDSAGNLDISQKRIYNVPGPLTTNDAPPRGYVDTHDPTNLIQNSDFLWGQRFAGPTLSAAVLNARTFHFDRWSAWVGAAGMSVTFQQQFFPANFNGDSSTAQMRMDVTTPVGGGTLYLTQEIDRAVLHQLHGSNAKLSFYLSSGGIPFPVSITVRIQGGSNAAQFGAPPSGNYTTGNTTLASNTVVFDPGTGFWDDDYVVTLGTAASSFPYINAASLQFIIAFPGGLAAQTFLMSKVMLVPQLVYTAGSGAKTFTDIGIPEWKRHMLNTQNELDVCRRFYEKSGPTNNFGVPTYPTTDSHLTHRPALTAAIGANIPMGYHPRFKAAKRATPAITLIHPVTGALGAWLFAGVTARTVQAIGISQEGFNVSPITTAFLATLETVEGHWIADASL